MKIILIVSAVVAAQGSFDEYHGSFKKVERVQTGRYELKLDKPIRNCLCMTRNRKSFCSAGWGNKSIQVETCDLKDIDGNIRCKVWRDRAFQITCFREVLEEAE